MSLYCTGTPQAPTVYTQRQPGTVVIAHRHALLCPFYVHFLFIFCSLSVLHREFNKNLVKPRTNTEVEAFKRKKKGKKAAAADDNIGMMQT